MGTKYSSTLPTGYNSNPPADDGSQVASNKVKYSTIKSKLADPFNDFASALDTALQAAFDTSSSITSVDYTTVASDHLKPIETSGTTTISLGDAATMESGYRAIVINVGTDVVTVGLATDTDTLNGTANGSITLQPNDCATFTVNKGADGYEVVSKFVAEPPTGSVLQTVFTNFTTYVSKTTIIPLDTTVPQNTEGDQVLTASITPRSSSSKLLVTINTGNLTVVTANSAIAALFRDSAADAIAAEYNFGATGAIAMTCQVDSNSRDETTFALRVGPNVTGTVYLNGNSTQQLLGGVMAVTMKITEVAA